MFYAKTATKPGLSIEDENKKAHSRNINIQPGNIELVSTSPPYLLNNKNTISLNTDTKH
jgi:hypothetical protein